MSAQKIGANDGDGDNKAQSKEGKDPQGKAEGQGGESGGIVTNKMQGVDPKEGVRLFSKTAPRDATVQRDTARWNPLADRDRAPLMERYIGELPLEYRDILRQYFESLAK